MKIGDFKSDLETKLGDLKENRLGLREVDAKQFAKLFHSMKQISSSKAIAPIGISNDRAYLEFTLYLTSEYRYVAIVAIVATDLAKLPDAIVAKLKR